ncbi:hypothetical protein SASPL_152241 [Salvia splendens]|uniref:Uncharacterized protein n=1 Tax=Salvia splendens TaxID=180675 RepID=A0A8X8Z0P9_SALSN|nr:hypothetical protein SASPL_152241 [Salvia splendens]
MKIGDLQGPLLGNLLQFDNAKPLAYLQDLSHKYGGVTYLRHGSTPILMVSSRKVAKQILKSQDSRPPVLAQQKLSYNGVDMAFSPYNPHWRETRRMCTLHLFSPKQILSFRPVSEAQVSRVVYKLHARLNQPANLSDMAMSLASNTIYGVAFGKTYDDDEYEKKKLDKLVLEAQALMVSFYVSDHFKVFGSLMIISTPFSSSESDIIDLMLKLKREKPDSITWDQIKALLMNLFVAGTDTVAAAIVWTMTALMLRLDIMRKTQEHIREVVGRKDNGIMITEDELMKLPYLKAVVMEALRLDPGIWEDPEEFVPERFLNVSDSDWEFKMIPFGGGRRRCPGMNMGMVSIHLALANLLYSFDWAGPPSAPPIDTEALPGFTMHKKNPLILLPTLPLS